MTKRRLVPILLALLMASLCACTPSGTPDQTSSAPQQSQAPSAQPAEQSTAPETPAEPSSAKISETTIEVPFFVCSGSYLYTGDELIFRAIEDATGIRLKPITVPLSNYTEKLNTTMASGDLPDLMNVRGSATIDKYGPQGAFYDLTPMIEAGEMPNFVEVVTRNDAMKYTKSPDGHVYGTPRIYDMDFRLDENYVIRKDVLDKNNIAMPTTWDELFDAMVKLKEIYPDSTPIANRWEAGHILEGMSNVRDAMPGFYLDQATNKVVFGPSRPGYKDALVYLNRCYEAGVLDPEFPTLTDDQWEAKYTNGKAFWAFDYADSFDGMTKAAREVDPDWDFVPWLHPTYEGKLYGTIVLKGYYGNYRAISAKSKYAKELAQFLEWTFTPAGIEMMQFGVEGDTYTKAADGTITLAPDIKYAGNLDGTRQTSELGINIADMYSVSNAIDRDIYNIGGPIMRASTELAEANKSYGPSYFYYKFADEDDSLRYGELRTQLTTYVTEMSVKVIMGQMKADDWDTTVKAELEKLGLEEALTLINAANDALNAK